MPDKLLSPRHLRFVQEYLKDGNATQAYIRAGYAARHAQSCSSRLLTEPHIEAALAVARQRLVQSLEVDVQRVAQEYAKIAFANISDFVEVDEDGRLRIDIDKAGQAQSAGLLEMVVTHGRQSQTVRLKLSKLKALDILRRHIDVLGQSPAMGLAAEERARLEEENAALRQAAVQRQSEQERLQRELNEARRALENAQANIERARIEAPMAESAADERSSPQVAITKPPIAIWPIKAPAAQKPVPRLHLNVKPVWPGGGPDSYGSLRRAMAAHGIGR